MSNETNQKKECLENVVQKLRLEVVKLGNNIREDSVKKINILDRDIKALRYDIKQLINSIKRTELLIDKLNENDAVSSHDISKKPVTVDKITFQKDNIKKMKDSKSIASHKYDFKYHQCEFVCQRKETLMKHTNTKHGGQT